MRVAVGPNSGASGPDHPRAFGLGDRFGSDPKLHIASS